MLRTCEAGREWSGSQPACTEINCGRPGNADFPNGWVEGTRTNLNAIITFRWAEMENIIQLVFSLGSNNLTFPINKTSQFAHQINNKSNYQFIFNNLSIIKHQISYLLPRKLSLLQPSDLQDEMLTLWISQLKGLESITNECLFFFSKSFDVLFE